MSQSPIRGKLVQYSAQGEGIRTWDLPTQGLFSIAVDPPDQMVYLGNAMTSEIFTINLQDPRNSTPRYLLEVYGTSSIGALALDTEHKRLFVADVVAGKLFVVDLVRRKTRVLAASLGEPSALAFDAAEQKLYIADAGRRRVWVLRPSASSQKPTVFSAPPEFSEPRGLTLDANHTVWVADYRARAIFALSPSGKVVRTIRQ
jgi:DNA-binding beta-propeller fold protein YncE